MSEPQQPEAAKPLLPVSIPQNVASAQSGVRLSVQQHLRIMGLASMGYSNSEIARVCNHSNRTVINVLRSAGIESQVEQARARLSSMSDKACNTVEHAITQRKDLRTAASTSLAVLKGTGALQDNPQVTVNVNVSAAPANLADDYRTIDASAQIVDESSSTPE